MIKTQTYSMRNVILAVLSAPMVVAPMCYLFVTRYEYSRLDSGEFTRAGKRSNYLLGTELPTNHAIFRACFNW